MMKNTIIRLSCCYFYYLIFFCYCYCFIIPVMMVQGLLFLTPLPSATTTMGYNNHVRRGREGGGGRFLLLHPRTTTITGINPIRNPEQRNIIWNLFATTSDDDRDPAVVVTPAKPTTATTTTTQPNNDLDLFYTDLVQEGLGLCHGLLQSYGIQQLDDLQYWTLQELDILNVDTFDYRNLLRVWKQKQQNQNQNEKQQEELLIIKERISTIPPQLPSLKVQQEEEEDEIYSSSNDNINNKEKKLLDSFGLERIVGGVNEDDDQQQQHVQQRDIYKGRLLTIQQCQTINQLAEQYAYQGIGTIGRGWSNELYTLTTQHMHCKDIPGLMTDTITPSSTSLDINLQDIFEVLFQALYPLFTTSTTTTTTTSTTNTTNRVLRQIVPHSIRFESDGEPHLIKYHDNNRRSTTTKSKRNNKGTVLHTDDNSQTRKNNGSSTSSSSSSSLITINVVLSNPNEYTGGGTYIPSLDDTTPSNNNNINNNNNTTTQRHSSSSSTIHLQQGEMLIHLGDLEHSGVDITSGVRRLLIAFLTCEWV